MSGHNKWSTIKHKKAATDAKRGKVFSRIAKELMIVARDGGGNPEKNISLRPLLQKARAANMPADNVDRAIKKGTGELEGETLEEMVYEGFAAGGVAILLAVLTDNKNRAASDIRHAFNKFDNSMAAQGSVSRLFHRKGQIIVAADAVAEDRLMEIVLEAGAEDMIVESDHFEVITDAHQFMDVLNALEGEGIPTEVAEITMIPEVTIPVDSKNHAASILKFIDFLEDLDDVQNVYSNCDISDEWIEELGEE